MEQSGSTSGKRIRIKIVLHNFNVVFLLTVILAIFVIIAGVCVCFLVEDDIVNKIILLGLIFIFVIIGITSLVLLKYLRRAELLRNSSIVNQRLANSPASTRTYWTYSRAGAVSVRCSVNENVL